VKPKKIDWYNTIPLNPHFGTDLDGDAKGGIGIPAYGKYGGPQITSTDDPVDDLDALFQVHDGLIGAAMTDGVLAPSELVGAHATLINGITGTDGATGPNSVNGLGETPNGLLVVEESSGGRPVGDAEATLYAGLTMFALTADIAQHGVGSLVELETALDPKEPAGPFVFDDISEALQEAARYLETGLEEAPSAGRGLHGALQLFEREFDQFLNPEIASSSTGTTDFML
jgi:hypothetical protein